MRLRRLPILLVYLLVLAGTPFGRTAALWMHVQTGHTDGTGLQLVVAPVPATVPTLGAPLHDAPFQPGHPAHRHADGPGQGEVAMPHTHHHSATKESESSIGRPSAPVKVPPVALAQPHEHGGVVHTHEDPLGDERTPVLPHISEHYLAPGAAVDWPQRIVTLPAPPPAAGPLETVAVVEAPPPRIG